MDKLYTYDKDGGWVKVTPDFKAKLLASGKRKENQFISEADYEESKHISVADYFAAPLPNPSGQQYDNTNKIYTYDRDSNWVKVTDDVKAKLIASGKRDEKQFISEADYEKVKDRNAGEYLSSIKPNENNQQIGNEFGNDIEKKQYLIDMLSGLYKGDLQGLVNAVSEGKTPKFSDKNQEEFYVAVNSIMNAPAIDADAVNTFADSDNRYLQFVTNISNRKGLYTSDDGMYREPTRKETFFPNLSEREGEGGGSQVIGAFHDVTTLLTRAGTAGTSMLTPYGDQLSFSQQMARPVGASTGAENFVDFAISGTPTGAAITKVVGGAGKMLRRGETLSKAVRDMSKANRGVGEIMARGALKGAGEGAAYSLEPAAVLATSPREESPWATFGEGMALGTATGAGVGALLAGGKILNAKNAGKYDPNELTGYGRELLIPKESLRRLQTAARREPLKDATKMEAEYANVLAETEKAFKEKLGNSRRQAVQDINDRGIIGIPENVSDESSLLNFKDKMEGTPWLKPLLNDERYKRIPHNKQVQIFKEVTEDLLARGDKIDALKPYVQEFLSGDQVDVIARKLPIDLEPVALKEWGRIRENLEKGAAFDMKKVEEEITRLNLLGSRATDPSRQQMYKEYADQLRLMEEKIADDFQRATTDQSLPQIRKDFKEAYDVMEGLPEPDKLIQSAATRLRPSTSSEFKRLIDAEKALNKLRDKYELPKTDILTDPVAAIVRGRVPPGAVTDPTLAQVVEKAKRGYIESGVRGVGGLVGGLAGGVAKGTVKGQVADAKMSNEEFVDPPRVIDMLIQGGSGKVILPPVTTRYNNVDEMWAEAEKEKLKAKQSKNK